MAKLIVDALGEQCPIPVVKTTKAISDMREPGIVEVRVDNETAVQNLLRMAAGKNYQAKSEKQGDKHFLVTIEVEQLGNVEETRSEEMTCLPDMRSNMVVAIGTETMGIGSDELGSILMKGFLYALSQQAELPKTILFYNGGAKLTTENSSSIEDLKTMEAQGVEILTCGTCLDYYGLKDKLRVGGVTNMYDIVTRLNQASRVIKP